MIEFGSDFHYCLSPPIINENIFSNKEVVYFANGRQAIQHLLIHNQWERIWIPTYFCYSVIEAIRQTGIKIVFYNDSPLSDDESLLYEINFSSKDVLLRVNYFGLRDWRDNAKIPIPVIEDHSHDLCGEWATKSNADWVIASLRKTLPVPEGGILWSPKKHRIPDIPKSTIENDLLTYKRLTAMLMKTLYLSYNRISKEVFRSIYTSTEENFENLPICSIEKFCKIQIDTFDIRDWYEKKKENWKSLLALEYENISIIRPENLLNCNPFALILKFNSLEKREAFRNNLIRKQVYPAILWNIPSNQSKEIVNISQSLLSVHCDARYSNQDISLLKEYISNAYYC